MLERAAEEDGTTFNAVVSSLATDYVVWTRKARKYGFMNVSKQLLGLILSACDDEKLNAEIPKRYAEIWRDEMIFWYRSISPESLVRLLTELSQHSSFINTSSSIDGKNYTVTLHHEFGPKFSAILKGGLDGLIRHEFHAQPSFEEGETSLTVRFSVP